MTDDQAPQAANTADNAGEEEEAPRPPRWVPALLVATILGLIAANNIGRLMLVDSTNRHGGPGGVIDHPVRILALNSTNAHLLATGFQVDWGWFLTVPFLRLLAPDPLFYLLGTLYRQRALRFITALYPGAENLTLLVDGEHESARTARFALDAMVVIAPNNPICAIAGIMAMPWRRFLVLNAAGTLGRLVLFKLLSERFQREIGTVIGWIADYQQYLLIGSLVLLGINFAVSSNRVRRASRRL